MQEDDVSDLRDVFDAINKLCETMKTSYDEYEDCEDAQEVDNVDTELVDPDQVSFEKIPTYVTEKWRESVSSPVLTVANVVPQEVEICMEKSYTVIEPLVSTPEVIKPLTFETCKTYRLSDTVAEPVITALEQTVTESEKAFSWSDTATFTLEPVFEKVRSYKSESDTIELQKAVVSTNIEVARNVVTERFEEIEPTPLDVETVQCEPMSEMYYTASSEVSLLSDVDFQDKAQSEDSDKDKDDRNSVMTGHVAAMRERFESMTRTNTPCPDLIRSTSPSFEVFRNSTSPDKLE